MAQAFDAYQAWLGIPPHEQPPNHYRLLGLLLFESNPALIDSAASRATAQVRGFQSGPYKLVAQRVLGEIAGARQCLLEPGHKAAYDRELQARMQGGAAAPGPALAPQIVPPMPASSPRQMQALQPVVVQVPLPGQVPLPAAPLPASAPLPSGAMPVVVQVPTHAASAATPIRPAPDSKQNESGPKKAPGFSLPQPVKIALGGAAGLFLGYFVVYFLTGRDLLGILPSQKPPPANRTVAENPSPRPRENDRPRPNPRPSGSNSQPSGFSTPSGFSNPPPQTFSPAPQPNPFAGPSESPSLPPTGQSDPPPVGPSNPSGIRPQIVIVTPQGTVVNPVPPNSAPLPGTTAAPAPAPPPRPKLPAPSADEQKAMLAELESIYSAEFERGAKADGRKEFVTFLLATARKLKTDPVAQFVLCRQAYDRAMRLEDFITAADVIDELERGFEVEGYRLRMHLLTESARAARAPEERMPLVLFALDLADHAIATQRPEDVGKLTNTAEGLARNIPNRDVKSHTTTRCIELRKAADELIPVATARAKLQSDPGDPAASLIDGKYRCFALGDWAGGIKLLAQSEDPTLAAAAKLDLDTKADDRQAAVAIGDAWFDLAQADPGLAPAFARARHWYQQALSGADGLEKVKLDKRIEQISAMNLPAPQDASARPQAPTLATARFLLTRMKAFETTNVISAITPQTVRTQGWYIYSDMLRVDNDATSARIQSPVNPTGEYQVALRVRRSTTTPHAGMFVVGLPHVRSQFAVVIDYPVPGKGFASFITLGGLKKPDDNPTLKVTENLVPRLGTDQQHIIICAVKLDEISVQLDGQELIQYRGDMSKLTMSKEWAVPDTRCMFLGSHQGGFYVHGWVVSPLVADDGTPLPLLKDPLEARVGPPIRP
ncbi:MAG TPA: hypothetical protein VFV87_02535 [Pirellulaceae bacterium]|nr:hypothetical protein [Pirellulaceae bacterium]